MWRDKPTRFIKGSETPHLPQQDLIISCGEQKGPRGREVTRLQWVTVLQEVLELATARLDHLQHSLCWHKVRNSLNPPSKLVWRISLFLCKNLVSHYKSKHESLPFDPTAMSWLWAEERLRHEAQWGRAIFFIICREKTNKQQKYIHCILHT